MLGTVTPIGRPDWGRGGAEAGVARLLFGDQDVQATVFWVSIALAWLSSPRSSSPPESPGRSARWPKKRVRSPTATASSPISLCVFNSTRLLHSCRWRSHAFFWPARGSAGRFRRRRRSQAMTATPRAMDTQKTVACTILVTEE